MSGEVSQKTQKYQESKNHSKLYRSDIITINILVHYFLCVYVTFHIFLYIEENTFRIYILFKHLEIKWNTTSKANIDFNLCDCPVKFPVFL